MKLGQHFGALTHSLSRWSLPPSKTKSLDELRQFVLRSETLFISGHRTLMTLWITDHRTFINYEQRLDVDLIYQVN